ncbi:hypothetical protein [Comamonas sp. lk]|uniref:hypothetical protein n=1 Tax=Comamonas sp. lk TaxID=2201272 RepID=UPI0013CE7C6E|nr:hypothetical protein [Comamonas sp. lk]
MDTEVTITVADMSMTVVIDMTTIAARDLTGLAQIDARIVMVDGIPAIVLLVVIASSWTALQQA